MLVWVDIETTGLNLDKLYPLELGLCVTDDHLAILWEENLVLQMPTAPADFDGGSTVIKMHADSGLLNESMNSPWLYGDAVEWLNTAVANFESVHGMEQGDIPLAGSNVQFDRAVLRHWYPDFEKWFHYRNIDVSSIKELARLWHPDAYNTRPGKDEADKRHRVLDDIHASQDELRHYVSAGFIRPDFLNLGSIDK